MTVIVYLIERLLGKDLIIDPTWHINTILMLRTNYLALTGGVMGQLWPCLLFALDQPNLEAKILTLVTF